MAIKINWYRLKERSLIMQSNTPQTYHENRIEGLQVRFDVVSNADVHPESFSTAGVVYNDCFIRIPPKAGEVNVHRNGKYGVKFGSDGVVMLGVLQ